MKSGDTATEPSPWDALDRVLAEPVEDEPDAEVPSSEQPEAPEPPATQPEAEEPASPAEADTSGQDQLEDEPAAGSDEDEAAADESPDAPADPPTAVEPEPPPPPVPFSYTAHKRDHQVPDAHVVKRADGGEWVVMPREAFTRHILPRIGDPEQRVAEQRRYERELRELREHRSVEQTKAKRVVELFEELVNAEDEDVLYDRVQKARAGWPTTKAEIEAAYWREQAERAKRDGTPAAPSAEQLEEARRDLVGRGIDSVLQANPQYQPVIDRDRLLNRLHNDRRLWKRAEQDDPERGVRAGQDVIDEDVFYQIVEDEGRIGAQLRAARADPKVTEAQKRNAAATGQQPGRKPAPAVRAQGSEAPGKRAARTATDLETWEAKLDALKP